VKVPQAFDPLRADLLSGLSEKHVCEKAATHPYLAVRLIPSMPLAATKFENVIPSKFDEDLEEAYA
jgi:hypothetical protein